MSQHQHAALPVEELQSVPQPVVSLLEVLLDKDPKRRFQTPAELLKALPTITGAIEEGSTITYQSMGQPPEKDSYSVARKPPARPDPENISIARLPVTGSDLFGREEDIAFLDDAWANPRCKCRHDRCLGWGRKVHADQPLAPGNGCATLSLGGACLWLVLLPAGQQWGHLLRR